MIDHAWRDDFAQARNVSLDAAHGEWILYIDADERLCDANRGRSSASSVDAPQLAFRLLLRPTGDSTPYREYRLWRHDPRIRFMAMIHEEVTSAIAAVSSADRLPIGDCDLLLEHRGYDGDQNHKHQAQPPAA